MLDGSGVWVEKRLVVQTWRPLNLKHPHRKVSVVVSQIFSELGRQRQEDQRDPMAKHLINSRFGERPCLKIIWW